MKLVRFIILLVLTLTSLRSFASGDKCEDLFLQPGGMADFVPFFEPVFRSDELQPWTEKLVPRNDVFVLGSTGQSLWVVEYRRIDNETSPRVRAVKYHHSGRNVTAAEVAKLKYMRSVFEKLSLLKYFDVLVPEAVVEGQDSYAVYPYVEAQSFTRLTRNAHRAVGRRMGTQDWQHSGGPIEERFDPALAKAWRTHQERLRIVRKTLRANGYYVESIYNTASSRKGYLESLLVESEQDGQFFAVGSDLLLTTDGRFVISDPM